MDELTKQTVDSISKEIDKRLADKVIEKSNADLLKKLLSKAESPTEALAISALGTTYKRTGFHFDKRLERVTDSIHYFKKNESLSFIQDKDALTHTLVIGDNYPALLNLLVQYRGQVDVIYIDPPYGKDDMGNFAETNYDNAITRDNLLSMLYPRLQLAKQLLSDTGIIFCSIDDKNYAYVKGLFDEVFGEGNFINTIIWQRHTGGGLSKKIITGHDYVLVYKKDIYLGLKTKFDKKEVTTKEIDGHLYYVDANPLKKEFGNNRTIGEERYLFYEDLDNKEKKKYDTEYFVKKLWKNGKHIIYPMRTAETKNIYSITGCENSQGIEDLMNLGFSKDDFLFPKPVELIKKVVYSIQNKNALVLDFFTGSGTTGQAVLELNKEDKGNRKFILVTNNEKTPTTPNGIAYDVTSKRLKRVMTGSCYDGTNNFKWLEKHKSLGDNLLVLDIAEGEEVAKVNSIQEGERLYDKIDETLYGKEKMGLQEKIEWLTYNFENVAKVLEN